MALTRYQIRNEYGLADKELYKATNKEDDEALLEGASMAGLVGVLRQLGDLAEFAVEVLHCLHEELMTIATRGRGLAMRLQQLQVEFPPNEILILSQTNHSTFFYDPGFEWHSNLQTEENLISPHILPHCIMDSYEECRGPPQLFLLDKFDVVGSGSCLKRYSDPFSMKIRTASAVVATSKLSKDERPHNLKKKVSQTTNGETHVDSRASHAKLHQLLLLEHGENEHRNPEFHMKLKRRQLNGPPIKSSNGTSYMEKFFKNSSPYCERVHETLDQSSSTMKSEVTACSIREDTPIPSLVYPNSGGTRKYNKMEMESIADDERCEISFVPQEITVNEKSLPNTEGGLATCLERSSSVNFCCKAANDTYAPASTESERNEADSDEKAGCNLGFPRFGQTQICTNADVTQTEVIAQFCNIFHHSPEEGGSSLVRISPESKLHKVEGSAVKVGVSFSHMTPEIDFAGMGILELEQTPFSLSCYENPPNICEDSGSRLELQYNKANADEIGLKSSEACEVFEVRRDPMFNISPEAHPEYLLKLTQMPLDAAEGGAKVFLTNNVEDHHSHYVFNVETKSEISLSGLVEDHFSSIEALEPEDISSEADLSIRDSKSSLKEIPATLKSDCLLPNKDISTFDNFEDLSLDAGALDNAAPIDDGTNSQDGFSMNAEHSGNISTFETNSENGTLISDTPRELHTGNMNLSASSWQKDALTNTDLVEISSYPGKEDPELMSTVVNDRSEPEVPVHDTQRHGTCFSGDVDHDNQTSLNSKASETVLEINLENISDPHECLLPEYCIQTHDQGQESPSEIGSANPITTSHESLPYRVSTQDVHVGIQGSPSEETLTCDEKLFPSSVAEREALHAPLQETLTLLNEHISESALSMDVYPESIVPFSPSLHETPQADLEKTPMLSPLPPTQWWMGKLVEFTKTTEPQFSPAPSLANRENNSFYIYRDENTENGSVQVIEAQYSSEASAEAVSTLSEPSEATEEQSSSAVNGTSDNYMHNDESTTKEESFGSLLTADATLEAESSKGLDSDWRTEATALEWFSQNLREHTNLNPVKLEEEPQLDQPVEPPGTLQESNSYDENEKAGTLPRDKDSLVIGMDRSMLRKVSEGNRTQVGVQVEENDSLLLEMIRNKPFNLKAADASVKPRFQVASPKINLKIAAILEKVKNLRQEMAGSDDDHDSNSWSD